MTRRRLDAELVRRGLVASRDEALEAVRAGLVQVAGATASKVATMVSDDEALQLGAAQPKRPVSRGAEKLAAALERFDESPLARDCLDAGASTGGFTDCLLRSGAARVIAVDVGYGQLAWSLRRDPRVTVLERTNVRSLESATLPFAPGLLVADLSFISLRTAMPSLVGVAAADAGFIVLVKPQFEAPKDDVGEGGVVRDPEVWRRAITGVLAAAGALGLGPRGIMASPLPGPSGNVEFLLHLRRGEAGGQPDVDAAIEEGTRWRP